MRLGFSVAALVAVGSLTLFLAARDPAMSSGAVAGKPCPPFSYKTIDGKTVSNATFKGKAFLIDVWSPT